MRTPIFIIHDNQYDGKYSRMSPMRLYLHRCPENIRNAPLIFLKGPLLPIFLLILSKNKQNATADYDIIITVIKMMK